MWSKVSPDNALDKVRKLRAERERIRGWIDGLFPKCRVRLWGPSSNLFSGYQENLCSGVKRSWPESPSSAKITNWWSYIYFPISLKCGYGDTFTLNITLPSRREKYSVCTKHELF